jgi:uncharacterized membrane protein YdjX (TVP38/TMEM64 family)
MREPTEDPALADGAEAHERHVRRAHLRQTLVFLALVVLAVLVVTVDDVHELMRRAVLLAEGVILRHPVWGAAVFVLLSAVSAMFAFFSTAVVIPVGVEAWGTTVCFLLLWLGWVVGGAGAYAIGRHLGRYAVTALVDPAQLAKWERRLSGRLGFRMILLVQIALPSELLGYVLGLARYPFRTYIAALVFATIPFALGAVLLGESLLERRYLMLVAVGAAGVALSAVTLRYVQRHTGG